MVKLKKEKPICEIGYFTLNGDHSLNVCRRPKNHKGKHMELDIAPWRKYRGEHVNYGKKYLYIYKISTPRMQGRT